MKTGQKLGKQTGNQLVKTWQNQWALVQFSRQRPTAHVSPGGGGLLSLSLAVCRMNCTLVAASLKEEQQDLTVGAPATHETGALSNPCRASSQGHAAGESSCIVRGATREKVASSKSCLAASQGHAGAPREKAASSKSCGASSQGHVGYESSGTSSIHGLGAQKGRPSTKSGSSGWRMTPAATLLPDAVWLWEGGPQEFEQALRADASCFFPGVDQSVVEEAIARVDRWEKELEQRPRAG